MGGTMMEIGKSLQQGFDLYIKNFGTLFFACLITGILTAITAGILAGPLIGGVLILCLKLRWGEHGELTEIFAHFDQFIPTLPVTLMLWTATLVAGVIGMVPFIGWMINIAVGPALGLLYFLAIGFVVDQKMKPLEALRRSIDCCAVQPLMSWFYSLVMLIIAGIGAILFFIPVFLTIPWGIMGLVIAYQQFSTSDIPLFKPGKQALRITGIALAVLFMAGIACMIFGFGRQLFSIPAWIR
jgi:hypothetical protein